MKIKVTKREVKERFKVYSAGYCDLQYLLNGKYAIFYNDGVYGWNWDGYLLDDNTLIVTGYRNLCGKDIPHQVIRIYEQKAKRIIKNVHDYDEQRNLLNKLRSQFLESLKAL